MIFLHSVPPFVIILIATILEVNGDAFIRRSIYEYGGLARFGMLSIGALLVVCYGIVVNLTAVEFGQVAGLYIATLFIVWQLTNFITFRTMPGLPVLVGGLLIVIGGLIVTFWKS